MSMYRIPTAKKLHGKTAGGYAKMATLALMHGGAVEIVSPLLPGCTLLLTDDDHLVIESFESIVALECSPRAARILRALTDRADAIMLSPFRRWR